MTSDTEAPAASGRNDAGHGAGDKGQGVASRDAALRTLAAVLQDGTTLSEALAVAVAGFDARDRAFAQTLVTTALRRLFEIDGLIDACLQHKLPKGALTVRHILRLGVTQLVFLGMPPHAVLDTANRLAERDPEPHVQRMKGLINGILRRLTRERPRPLGPAAAGKCNTPDWLYEDWTAAYGAETAAAIAAQHMTQPPVDITLKADEPMNFWAEHLEADILPSGSLRRAADGAISDLPGFAHGHWWVQDAAAALPVRLAGDLSGQAVIDLCAAPGGKTAQLASAGARVTAVDRSDLRLQRLYGNLTRLDLTAEVVVADATLWQPPAPVPFVLLDAPCSATGTIRRHPDLPHIRTRRSLTELQALQERLADNAAGMVAPGGLLIYCVCSLHKAEGEERVAAFLAGHPDFRRDPILAQEAPGLEMAVTDLGELRILPHVWAARGGIDGFFIARLRRLG